MTSDAGWRVRVPSPVVTALLLGIACGLFLGDLVRPLQVVADGFIRLLQMAVLPYIVVSLTAAVGRLTSREARLLAGAGGAILLLLWLVAFAVVVATPLAFPPRVRAGFFSTTLVAPHEDFDLLRLYIPDNPFRSLSDNVVPAVVLFCLVLGVAIMGVPDRRPLLDVLDVLTRAFERVNGFVARIMPLGVFAITATAAGTLGFTDLWRIQVFLVTFVVTTGLVTFWILPRIVAAALGTSTWAIVRSAREMLAAAFSTGSMLLVLPSLGQASRDLAVRVAPDDEETRSTVDVLIPISFNFPHAGKILTLGFVLFAAWFAGRPLGAAALVRLGLAGVVATFGSMNVALPFLLDAFVLPADLFQLFLAVAVVTYRFQTLAGSMHTLALTVLGTCAARGRLVPSWPRILRAGAGVVAVSALALAGTRLLLLRTVSAGPGVSSVRERRLQGAPVETTVLHAAETPPPPAEPALDRIARTGTLRVAYLPARMPFSYVNARGELVGFDVDMMHRLARELGARLVFVPLDRARLAAQFADGRIDVAIGALETTTDLSRRVGLSAPYLSLTMALVVPDARREEFATRAAVRAHERLRLGLVSDGYYEAKVRAYVPNAEIVRVDAAKRFFEGGGLGLDGLVIPFEIGAAWTLVYPDYGVVVPEPDRLATPIAYATALGDASFRRFVDTWLLLKREDGTIARLRRWWIDGVDDASPAPRWSVVRDVLHWVR